MIRKCDLVATEYTAMILPLVVGYFAPGSDAVIYATAVDHSMALYSWWPAVN